MATQTRSRPEAYTCPQSKCPCCGYAKIKRQYVCADCWSRLPKGTRDALYRRDDQATERYHLLLSWLRAGFEPEAINII